MTTENIFSAVLTLSLLAGGAVAFGSDAASKQAARAKAETTVVTLPTVTVIGRRAAPMTVAAAETVTLPTVTAEQVVPGIASGSRPDALDSSRFSLKGVSKVRE